MSHGKSTLSGRSAILSNRKMKRKYSESGQMAIFSNSAHSTSFQLGEHGDLLPVERAVPQDGQERRPLPLHLRPQRGQGGRAQVRTEKAGKKFDETFTVLS